MEENHQIRKFISARQIRGMINRLAVEILQSHQNSELVFVTVLDGALPFSTDLTRNIMNHGFGFTNHAVRVNSYDGTNSSGDFKIKEHLSDCVGGKDVLIVEDIVDTGKTADFLRNYLLNEKGAEKVEVVSLLSKPSQRIIDVKIDYLGREIPDEFVVGYGMDFNGMYRDLNYVGVLGG